MFTNSDITVFSLKDEKFTRTEIRKVFRMEEIDRETSNNGVRHYKHATVYIPLSSVPDNFTLNVGDVIVKGIVQHSPAQDTENEYSKWHKYIKANFESNTVTEISMHDYGSPDMQHIKVVAK